MSNGVVKIYSKAPKDVTPVFFCPDCRAAYSTEHAALTCAERNADDVAVKVGDVIAGGVQYGWHTRDGWIAKKDKDGMREFYWVVTAINQCHELFNQAPFNDNPSEAHSTLISIHTLGVDNMQGLKNGGLAGYTCRYHHPMRKVPTAKIPQCVRDAIPLLIGPTYKNLI